MEYYLSVVPIDNGTQFKLNNHIFYIYTSVRRKNLIHLYTPSLRSLARIIFLQYLKYTIQFPELQSGLFPTVKYEYSKDTSTTSYLMYYDTIHLHYKIKEHERTCENFDFNIARTLTFTEIAVLLDYQSLQTYLETEHKVTKIEVIEKIFVDELNYWAKLIHTYGFEDTFQLYFYPSQNDIINYLLVKNYIELNCGGTF